MTRQHRLPARQQAISERISLAPDADDAWQPNATWREWCDWLRPAMVATYRALRRSCAGGEYFRSLLALAEVVGVNNRMLHLILDDLEHYGLIRVQRERGTIISIQVGDPPPVPENIAEDRRRRAYNLPDPPAPADVRRWIDYWCSKWEALRGAPYQAMPRDRPLVKAMLPVFGLDLLKRMAWWVLANPNGECDDEVIRRAEISIGSFHARRNQIATALAAYTARRKLDLRLQEAQRAERAARLTAADDEPDEDSRPLVRPRRPRRIAAQSSRAARARRL